MGSADPALPLTRDSVIAAHELIKPHIHFTPVQTNTTLSNLASTPQTADALRGTLWEGQEPAKPNIKLFFKCENFQRIGAFKVRGAFHAVKRLIERDAEGIEGVRRRGVVTHSSGMFLSMPDSLPTYPPIRPSARYSQRLVQYQSSILTPPQETTPKPSPLLPAPSPSPPTLSCPAYPRPPRSPAPAPKTHTSTSAGPHLKNARRSSTML